MKILDGILRKAWFITAILGFIASFFQSYINGFVIILVITGGVVISILYSFIKDEFLDK